MYYYIDCLQKRGKFGLLWRAAFGHAEFKKKSIKFQVQKWDVDRSCEDVLKYLMEGRENSPRMNLYVTSVLLTGLTKVFKEKAVITLRDVGSLYVNWNKIARTLSIDVVPKKLKRKSDPTEFNDMLESELHGSHLAVPSIEYGNLEKLKGKKRKHKRETIDEEQIFSNINESKALLEMLRAVDAADVSAITMIEEPPRQIEVPAEDVFGPTILESLLPEVLETMQVDLEMKSIQESVLPQLQEIDENQIPPIEASIERVEEVPPEVDHPLPSEKEKNGTGEGEQQASIAVEQQVPPIPVERREEGVLDDIDRLIEEMFETEEEVEPGRERIKRSKDAVTEISMKELRERNTNFLKLMRCADPIEDVVGGTKKQKSQVKPDFLISAISKPLIHFLQPTTVLEPNGRHLARIPNFYEGEEKVPEYETEVQQIRDGGDLSRQTMHSHGSPTPHLKLREGHVRVTPSPSPLGRDRTRSHAEIPIPMTLEPIAELAVPCPPDLQMLELDNLLEQTILPEEIPIQPTEEPIQQIEETVQQVKEPSHTKKHLAEEEVSPQKKRPRSDDLQSSEESLSRTNYEDSLLSSLQNHLATNETATFKDLVPPSLVKKKDAARFFSALLDLEKKGIVKTEQAESFGAIYIYPVERVD